MSKGGKNHPETHSKFKRGRPVIHGGVVPKHLISEYLIRECLTCGGTGVIYGRKCVSCGGTGIKRDTK